MDWLYSIGRLCYFCSISLNTAEINIGDMGSDYRRVYTLLGGVVKLGSRLESLTKFYGIDLLVNEIYVASYSKITFRLLDKVRDKDTAVSIIKSLRSEVTINRQVIDYIKKYYLAYQNYLVQNWLGVIEKINALISKNADRKIYSS